MPEISRYQKINDFLKLYENKPNSLNKHSKALELFLSVHPNITPDTYFKDTRTMSKTKELQITDQIEKDIIIYQQELEKSFSPNTIKAYISSIRTFLTHNRITLDEAFWNELNRLKSTNGNSHNDMTPTKQQLKKILSNADPLEKALFLTIINTGLREKEILNIQIKELHLEENPPRINITIMNTNTKRRVPFTYITEECKDTIQIWLEQRNDYIQRTKEISNLPIKWETHDELFPITEVTARRHWNNLLTKVKLNEQSTNQNGRTQYLFHLYTLRKFFRTNLDNKDLAEYFIGHKNLSNQYWLKNQEEIKKDYLKYSKNLYILTNPILPENITEELKQRDKEIENLKNQHNYDSERIKIIQNELNRITKFLTELEQNTNNEPYEPKTGIAYKINEKGEQIDVNIDPKTNTVKPVSKSQQNSINESYLIKEQMELIQLQRKYNKNHPEDINLPEQEYWYKLFNSEEGKRFEQNRPFDTELKNKTINQTI